MEKRYDCESELSEMHDKFQKQRQTNCHLQAARPRHNDMSNRSATRSHVPSEPRVNGPPIALSDAAPWFVKVKALRPAKHARVGFGGPSRTDTSFHLFIGEKVRDTHDLRSQ